MSTFVNGGGGIGRGSGSSSRFYSLLKLPQSRLRFSIGGGGGDGKKNASFVRTFVCRLALKKLSLSAIPSRLSFAPSSLPSNANVFSSSAATATCFLTSPPPSPSRPQGTPCILHQEVLIEGGTLKVNKHGGSTFSAKKIKFANICGIRHRSELVLTLRHADYHNRPPTGGEESHQYLCIPGRDFTARTHVTPRKIFEARPRDSEILDEAGVCVEKSIGV